MNVHWNEESLATHASERTRKPARDRMITRLATMAAKMALSPLGLEIRRVPQHYGYSGPTPPKLQLHHVEKCRVLADREDMLRLLPAGGIVAELGVADGEFSDAILRLNRPKQLYLIDPWESSRYAAGHEYITQRFHSQIGNGQIVVMRGRSTHILEQLPDSHLDWAYIDTDHSYETTLAELELCGRKVKPNGHIAGHDFSRGNPVNGSRYGVIPACHKFCSERGWELEFLTVEYDRMFSFCLRKATSGQSATLAKP